LTNFLIAEIKNIPFHPKCSTSRNTPQILYLSICYLQLPTTHTAPNTTNDNPPINIVSGRIIYPHQHKSILAQYLQYNSSNGLKKPKNTKKPTTIALYWCLPGSPKVWIAPLLIIKKVRHHAQTL
jgi:hypothetical protein